MRLGGGGVRGVGVLASLFEQALLLLLLFLCEFFFSLFEVEVWFCQLDHLSLTWKILTKPRFRFAALSVSRITFAGYTAGRFDLHYTATSALAPITIQPVGLAIRSLTGRLRSGTTLHALTARRVTSRFCGSATAVV